MEWLVAIAGLSGIFIGEWLQRRRDRSQEQRRLEASRSHLAAALHAELIGLHDRYMMVIGKELEGAKSWNEFLVEWPVDSNYFVVFDGNTERLGLLGSSDAQSVISAYISAKGHLDAMKAWGRFCTKLGDAGTSTEVRNNLILQLTLYFPKIKQSHSELLKSFESVLARLRAYFDYKHN